MEAAILRATPMISQRYSSTAWEEATTGSRT